MFCVEGREKNSTRFDGAQLDLSIIQTEHVYKKKITPYRLCVDFTYRLKLNMLKPKKLLEALFIYIYCI